MPEIVTRKAYAKINLALHVTGRQKDGYHLLDSLVVFADYGDVISLQRAQNRAPGDHYLTIDGPFSDDLETNSDNLVLKAVKTMGQSLPALDINLIKNLPIASGIGGGSADAAATLSSVSALLDIPFPKAEVILSLGADVPVCTIGRTTKMSGIGEEITEFPPLPDLSMLLVNPGIGISTPVVFKALTNKENTPLLSYPSTGWSNTLAFADWINKNRNDLEQPACEICPQINACLRELAALDDVLVCRMSGSGATCFALFDQTQATNNAATILKNKYPDWWVVPTHVRNEI